jgi:hypothetical protein
MSQGFRSPTLFYLARQHRLAYLQIPKVACTSIKTAIALMNRPDLAEELQINPDLIHTQPDLSDIVRVDSPELYSLLRFTFVRDPYARFVSFYWSKIAGDGNPVPRFQRLGFIPGMSIDDVLDRVEATDPFELDPHLTPQSAYVLRNNRLHVDFIGRIERFAEDIKLVEAWSGTRLNIGELNVTNKVEARSARDTLSRSQRSRVQRLYARDFELLGYDE